MKIKKGFTLRSVMGQNVVLAEDAQSDSFAKIITLNSSATMLWKELVGRKGFEVADVARLLVDTYGIDSAEALADAERFVGLMSAKGLLD